MEPIKEEKRGRPKKEAMVEKLKAHPKTMPIREHPYVLYLASKWEDLHAEIGKLQREQDELSIATSEFKEGYPEALND